MATPARVIPIAAATTRPAVELAWCCRSCETPASSSGRPSPVADPSDPGSRSGDAITDHRPTEALSGRWKGSGLDGVQFDLGSAGEVVRFDPQPTKRSGCGAVVGLRGREYEPGAVEL